MNVVKRNISLSGMVSISLELLLRKL